MKDKYTAEEMREAYRKGYRKGELNMLLPAFAVGFSLAVVIAQALLT